MTEGTAPPRRETRVTLPSGESLAVDVYEAEHPRGALISVHGFGSARRGGKIEALGAALPTHGWTVIAPDLRGHGDSDGAFALTTVARGVEDVLCVAELGAFSNAPRRALVGSSFGGLVAGWATVDAPSLTDGLVLVAPAFGFLDRYLETLPPDERAEWEGGASHALRVPHLAGRTLAPEVLDARKDRRWQDLAARLSVPSLIVHGRNDEAVPWEASIEFAAACPRDDLDVVLLGGGDHRLAEHLPDLVDHSERFLNGIVTTRCRNSN